MYRTVINALAEKESLLYSFRAVLGNGLLPTIGYYAASPFHFLLLLFPDNPVAGIHLIAAVKWVCTALSFCILLNATSYDAVQDEMSPIARVAIRSAFSSCYAFISYMVFYSWNLTWMDGVMVLPLIALGIIRLIEKKKVLLYIFSLAYALIANYYIGYMLCIGSVLIYIFYQLFRADALQDVRHTLKGSFVRYALSSLCAGALSAFLLLPIYLGLPEERIQSADEAYETMRGIFNFTHFFSGLFTGRTDAQSDNLPLIYFGVIPVVLIVCFLFDKSVTLYKKLVWCALGGVFFLSFWNSTVNMVWHGMSVNAWFNYRYSFLFSFLMLWFAYRMLLRIGQARISYRYVVVAVLVFFVWVVNDTMGLFFAKEIMYDIAQILVSVWLFTRIRKSTLPYVVIAVMMLAGAYMNTIAITSQHVAGSFWAQSFFDTVRSRQQVVEAVEETAVSEQSAPQARDAKGAPFYRMDFAEFYTRNDSFLLGYRGISNYLSTENRPLLDALCEFGLEHDWYYGNYNAHMPLAIESLTGMRYIASARRIEHKGYVESTRVNGHTVYRNDAALPLFFAVRDLVQEDGTTDPFTQLNRCFSALSESPVGEVMTRIPFTYTVDADGIFHISLTGAGDVPYPVYLHLPEGRGTMDILCDTMPLSFMDTAQVTYLDMTPYTETDGWVYKSSVEFTGVQRVYYIGTFAPGSSVRIDITSEDELFSPDRIHISRELIDRIGTVASAVQAAPFTMSMESDARLTVTYRAARDTHLASTIPYDEAWRVSVDGQETETARFMGLFLSIPLEEGEHTISLIYRPKGLTAGITLSVLALICVLAYAVSSFYNKHRGDASSGEELPVQEIA